MHIRIVMELPADAATVPLVRRTVAEAMRSAGVARECVEEAELALSEACTNVYHHSGTLDHYEVAVELDSERLTMDIVDTGEGVPELHRNPTMPDGSAENGRGLALMAAFSDQVVFDSVHSSGASVHLMKKLRWDSSRRPQSADTRA